MIKLLSLLAILLSAEISTTALLDSVPNKKEKKEKEKNITQQKHFDNNIVHYPYFDLKKKKLDDE